MLNHTPAPITAPTMAEPPPFAWLPAGLAFLRRNMLLIGGSAALLLAGGLVLVALSPSQYTATTTLVIDSRRPHPVRAQPLTLDAQSENVFVESQVELLRGAGTLRAVVERLALDRDPRFWNPDAPQGLMQQLRAGASTLLRGAPNTEGLAPGDEARASAARLLGRELSVRRVGMTAVVEIGFTSPSRRLSADVANAVAAAYIEDQLGGNAETTRRAGDWLEVRIRELRGNAVAADRAVQEYKAANNIVDIGPALLSDQELTETVELVAAARARFAEAAARAQRIEEATPDAVLRGSPVQGSVAEALQNPVITRLRQQFLDGSRREAELSVRHGANHGAAVLLRSEMAELQRAIQNELGRIAEVHRSERRVAEENMRGMEAQLAQLSAAATRTNIERSELRSLQSTADASRAIFENFLQRYTQAMQDQSYPIADARVMARAIPPLERSKPKPLIILAAALTAGLMLGVGLAILHDALDGRVRTPEQLAEAAGAPRVWLVEESRRLRLPDGAHEAVAQPASAIAQAVQGVRGTVARLSARGAAIKVVGVAGAVAGEGASLFAANLAHAVAASGRRVALVLWDGAREAAADGHTGLRVVAMPSGNWRAAAILMAELRQAHDLVVLDMPPLNGIGGAVALHDMLDGTVLVARWGRTTCAQVREAMGRVAAMDGVFLGAVLNRGDRRRMRLYGQMPALAGVPRAPQAQPEMVA